jgi:hypothetical protein
MSSPIRATITAAAAVSIAACAAPDGSVVERFDLSKVEVRVRFEPGRDGGGTVVTTFAPTEPGLHLYGTSMPDGGVEGVGRPTRVVVVDAGWTATGEAITSVAEAERTLPGFDDPFPVYPPGDVTLRLPVVPESSTVDTAIDLQVTFMACRETLCFKPVVAHPIVVGTG